MKRNQSTEDYLECILLLSRESEFIHRVDIARRIGVTQPAVQKAIKILVNAGYVKCEGLHIHLTPEGQAYAEKVYDRHCTIRQYLLGLGVNEKDADADACEMEHVLSECTYEAIKATMNKD